MPMSWDPVSVKLYRLLADTRRSRETRGDEETTAGLKRAGGGEAEGDGVDHPLIAVEEEEEYAGAGADEVGDDEHGVLAHAVNHCANDHAHWDGGQCEGEDKETRVDGRAGNPQDNDEQAEEHGVGRRLRDAMAEPEGEKAPVGQEGA